MSEKFRVMEEAAAEELIDPFFPVSWLRNHEDALDDIAKEFPDLRDDTDRICRQLDALINAIAGRLQLLEGRR